MTRRIRRVALLAALALPAKAALAEPPFYFHKPMVDRALFDNELGACVELAGGAAPKPQQVYSPNLAAAAIGGFFGGIMASRERRSMALNIMRTCMGDKGYQRVVAPKEIVREFGSLKDEARTARLFELATATTPLGEVLPQ